MKPNKQKQARMKHIHAPKPSTLKKELLRKWLDPDEEQEKLGKALAERVYQESTLFAKFSSWKDKVIESIANPNLHECKQIHKHWLTNA
jgi:putative SOS response-associated peptidase YedK